jgi:outer membrane protein insertion porin family
MKSGSVLDIQKVQSEIGKIADLYWNEGYVENTLDIREARDVEAKTIHYTLVITERAQAIVEEVLIRGLTKTKPYVLERELVLRAGDIFSKEKYINSAQNLYNTGLLTDIKPSIGYGTGENSLVVTYEVTEGNQMNVGFGATFGGNVDGFPVSGFLSWSDTNLWGTGRDLSISTELAPDSQTVSIGFSDNWVLDKRWSNALNFSFEHSSRSNGLVLGDLSPDTSDRNNQAYPNPYTSYAQWEADGFQTPSTEYLMPYEYYQLSANYSTGYTFMFDSGRLSLGFGPTFTLNRAVYDTSIYKPFDYLIEQYSEGWKFSNRVGLSLSWDGRDFIKNTTRGYVVSQNFTYAGGILGGLSNYMRSSTSASGFLKIFEIPGDKPTPGVLSLNSTISLMFDQYYNTTSGWDWNLSASKYEYLYIDGMSVGRGFEPQTYKKFMWDTSLEFSIQLVENLLWGEVFASATGVSAEISDVTSLRSLDWYMASGVGIKLKIPGFPLGLYMVKNATMLSNENFTWIGGPIFKGTSDTSGLKLVLAITTSLF